MDTGHNSSSAHGRDPAKATEGHGASSFCREFKDAPPPSTEKQKEISGAVPGRCGEFFPILATPHTATGGKHPAHQAASSPRGAAACGATCMFSGKMHGSRTARQQPQGQAKFPGRSRNSAAFAYSCCACRHGERQNAFLAGRQDAVPHATRKRTRSSVRRPG